MTETSTDTWDVHVMEFARSRQQRMAGLIHGAPLDEVHDLPFSFVLARRADWIVLCDTGFMREGTGEAMSIKFDVPYWISPLRLLAEMGVGPNDVTDIVLSHAHFDHMGSIGKFPKARLHIQKREILSWHEAMALPPAFGFLTEIINPDDLRSAFDAAVEHRLNLVDGDVDDLLPGVHVRLGEATPWASSSLSSRRGAVTSSCRAIASIRAATSAATTKVASMCRSPMQSGPPGTS